LSKTTNTVLYTASLDGYFKVIIRPSPTDTYRPTVAAEAPSAGSGWQRRLQLSSPTCSYRSVELCRAAAVWIWSSWSVPVGSTVACWFLLGPCCSPVQHQQSSMYIHDITVSN